MPNRTRANARNAVVVLSEWWGLSSTELSLAERLADMGYAAALPNIYREPVPFDSRVDFDDTASVTDEVISSAWKMKTLAWDIHSSSVLDIVSYLKGRKGMQKVVLMGFSEGACLALVTASQSMRSKRTDASIDGVVAFYGSPLKA